LYNHIELPIHLKRTLFWVETCCENLNKEKSKVLFVGVYFLQKTFNILINMKLRFSVFWFANSQNKGNLNPTYDVTAWNVSQFQVQFLTLKDISRYFTSARRIDNFAICAKILREKKVLKLKMRPIYMHRKVFRFIKYLSTHFSPFSLLFWGSISPTL